MNVTEVGTRYFSCSVGSAPVQAWAHCSVLNQKVTVNVVAAADPDASDPDPDASDPAPKASSAATVGVTMGAATAMASVLL